MRSTPTSSEKRGSGDGAQFPEHGRWVTSVGVTTESSNSDQTAVKPLLTLVALQRRANYLNLQWTQFPPLCSGDKKDPPPELLNQATSVKP